jgi:nucleotidyltransferase/DNA polymerase involved in DNA repair
MKVIKDYLNNQKDIYTMMWINEQKKEKPNIIMIKYWLDKVIFMSEEIEGITKNKVNE